MAYLLDANVFIEAKRFYYGFDFCPAFWEWLVLNNRTKKVYSIEKVSDEIEAGNDDLWEWVKSQGSALFLEPDEAILPALAKVSEWATGGNYHPAAVNEFFSSADYYLVAHALAHHHTIVTQEQIRNSKKRIMIPEACIPFKIKCIQPHIMLRKERARFVLGK